MDTENNLEEQVAPVNDETQSEQVAETETSAQATETASEQAEKLYAGKFKSPEDMEKSYEELQSKFTKTAQEKAELERLQEQISKQPETGEDVPDLDPTVIPALDKWYRQQRLNELQAEEDRKTSVFAAKHAEELADPVLRGTVMSLFEEARSNKQYLDHEQALSKAKEMLDSRVKPQVQQAKAQGEQEGSKIAQERAKMGAIGETPSPQKLNVDDMTADEYATYLKLPRA